MIDDDKQYQEYVIQTVIDSGDGYELRASNGWAIWCPAVEGLNAPKCGETARLYGRGIGAPVRGIVIEGRIYRYQTEVEQEREHQQWCSDQQTRREREYTESVAETDRRIDALPPVLRERIKKFQLDGGHKFRRDYERYELFCCEQAVIIANTLKTSQAVREFKEAKYDKQKALVPGLSYAEHSGNTFGVACVLAYDYLSRTPERVIQEHGALTPLVGCDAYGCAH